MSTASARFTIESQFASPYVIVVSPPLLVVEVSVVVDAVDSRVVTVVVSVDVFVSFDVEETVVVSVVVVVEEVVVVVVVVVVDSVVVVVLACKLE